jgi:hypothetical protein
MTTVDRKITRKHGGHRPPLQTKMTFAEISFRVERRNPFGILRIISQVKKLMAVKKFEMGQSGSFALPVIKVPSNARRSV